MNSELKDALIHSAKLATAVFAVVFLEPKATQAFPDAPLWLVLACIAIVAAVGVELLTLLVVGRPTVELVWYLEQDPLPISEIQANMPTSLAYKVQAMLSGGSWLTRLAVRRLVKSDAVISIRFPSSPAKVVIDKAPRDANGERMLAVPNNANGFDLELANTTLPSSMWTWAEIRFETATPGQNDLSVDTIYKCSGSGARTNLSARVLVVKSKVKVVRFRSK